MSDMIINGNKLMMALSDWWYSSFGQEETEESKAIKTVLDKIEESLDSYKIDIPSAQPERKKGKWILCDNQRREDISNGNYMYFCTNCLHSDLHSKSVVVPYCWYCGADMRGEEDE